MEQCATIRLLINRAYTYQKRCLQQQKKKSDEMLDVPYRALVGALLYLSTRTRPDIAYIVGQLCRFMNNPGQEHWTAAKRVLRYLKGTSSLGVRFYNDADPLVYTDSDWAGDPDQRRSTGGFVFMMGGGPISWASHRSKSSSALSAVEAEYVAMSRAAREASWTNQLIGELTGIDQSIVMRCDNQGAAAMAANRRTDARTKHIDVKYHYTRDMVENGTVTIEDIRTNEMVADFLTKPIDTAKFKWCRHAMGMIDVGLRGCVEPSLHRSPPLAPVNAVTDATSRSFVTANSVSTVHHSERSLDRGAQPSAASHADVTLISHDGVASDGAASHPT